MNTRFKFLLINYLGRYKLARNSGFALPMAIMVGACIIIVGLAVVIQAQGNKSKVTSQVTTSQADALAEAGATRYIDFLNSHPVLLSAADHTAWATQWTGYLNGTIDGTGQSTGGGSTPQSGTTCENTNLDSAGNTVTPSNPTGVTSTQITNTWANPSDKQDVGNGQGKIKLVGYKYDSATQTAALGVQGIVGEGQANQATSQLKFTFQVGQKQSTPASPSPSGTPIIPQTNPGLWARNFVGNINDNAPIYANVLDSSACGSGTSLPSGKTSSTLPLLPMSYSLGNGNLPAQVSQGVSAWSTNPRREKIPFPPLPTYPTTPAGWTALGPVNQLTGASLNTDACNDSAYPRSTDVDSNNVPASTSAIGKRIFRYRVSSDYSCGIANNTSFGAAGNQVIVFYIDGSNFSVASGQGNNPGTYPLGNSTKVIWNLKQANLSGVGGNGVVGGNNSAANWSFFLHDANTVGLQGNQEIYAFVFGPNATLDAGGGGGTSRFGGAFWGASYTQGSSGNSRMFQGINQDDLNNIFKDAYTASGNTSYANYTPGSTPTTTNAVGSVTGFQKQAVSDTTTFLASALPNAGSSSSSSSSTPSSSSSSSSSVASSSSGSVASSSSSIASSSSSSSVASSSSSSSSSTTTIPSAPTLSATSSATPTVTWSSVAGATSYKLYRCQSTQNNSTCTPSTSGSTVGTTSPYTEATAPSEKNRKLCYVATASNAAGTSPASGAVCGIDRSWN